MPEVALERSREHVLVDRVAHRHVREQQAGGDAPVGAMVHRIPAEIGGGSGPDRKTTTT